LLQLTPTFGVKALARVVNQNVTHHLRRGPKEVRAILPLNPA